MRRRIFAGPRTQSRLLAESVDVPARLDRHDLSVLVIPVHRSARFVDSAAANGDGELATGLLDELETDYADEPAAATVRCAGRRG